MTVQEEAFDFHLHTTRSDGVREPRVAIELAREAGLAGLSITDHDTVAAHADLRRADAAAGRPRLLPGIEVSTAREGVEIHILGYFPAGIPPGIDGLVRRLLTDRTARMREGLRNLAERGIDIHWSDVREEAGSGVISRGHLAQLLVRKGYVPNIYAAFPGLLGPDVVPPPGIDARDVVTEIRGLGGLAVWAHPSEDHLEPFLEGLVAAGLSGIELFTPRRRRTELRRMSRKIASARLLATGGSDWHGQDEEPLGRFAVSREEVRGFLEAIGW